MHRFYARYFRRCRSAGFTFVEILLVVVLLGVIGVALYNAFANGLAIWERSNYTFAEEDIMIFFDKISYDLRNTLPYSKIRFNGNKHQLAFATVVSTPVDTHKSKGRSYFVDEIGRVEYEFDRSRRQLYRRQGNYSQALDGTFGEERLLMSNGPSVEFLYYYRGIEEYEEAQKATDIIPTLVKITVEFWDGKNKRNMVKVVALPVGT